LSNYSFLEGASFPEELVMQAAAFDLPAIAVTDRDGMYGMVRAHVAAREAGIKLLVGSLVTRSDGPPVVLLACTARGYASVCKLISQGRGGSEKGRSAVTTQQLAAECGADVLLVHPCFHEEPLPDVLASEFRRRLYAGIARHMLPDDQQVVDAVCLLARKHGVPTVVAPRVLFHSRQRKGLCDVLASIRHLVPIADLGRRVAANSSYTLLPHRVVQRLYHSEPSAVAASVEVADRCSFSLDELKYHYPSEVVPPGETPMSHLTRLTRDMARQRYPEGVPADVRAQLDHELGLIDELHYPNYFLTMHDIVRHAREAGILCQGRGSAANSAVCYVLGITAVDPVRSRLLFERFISRERNEPPDIDVDFEHERREEVIQYIYNRFGRDRAAMVAEFIRYRTRSAIRDVGKALGYPLDLLDRLSDLASSLKRDQEHWWDAAVAGVGLDPQHPRVRSFQSFVREIKGFPRHLSIHVGGFVISDLPVHHLVPVEPARMEGRTVIQWDKEDVEDAGLLKIDVLALGMLTCLRRSFDLLRSAKGVSLDLHTIPPEDPATYRMIQAADTVGVFQIESRAQMSMLPRLRPKEFYDLVVEVAIVRPGPIQGKMVHPYLRRRKGEEPVTYPLPELKDVLGRTYGVPLFQEQVMKLAMVAAGFTGGEADQLRRAMGTWRSNGRLDGILDKLLDRMEKRGISRDYAEQIANQIKGFGEYGFPESHAASFALLAYASAYVKRHHPDAFTAALLNSQPMGFYSPATLVDDVRRAGVCVLNACVNHSDWDCTLDRPAPRAVTHNSTRETLSRNCSIRLGFSMVKGLPREAADTIVLSRAQGGPFRSFPDFVRRTLFSSHALLRLALAGSFDCFLLERRQALFDVLCTCTRADNLFFGRRVGTGRVAVEPMAPFEVALADLEATRTYLNHHPFSLVYPELRSLPGFVTAAELPGLRGRRKVVVGGLSVVRQRPPTAGGVLFMTLEDHTGLMNLVIMPQVFQRFRQVVLDSPLLLVEGLLEQADGVTNIRVQTVRSIRFAAAAQAGYCTSQVPPEHAAGE
jgi:error-prone DNA polymerase